MRCRFGHCSPECSQKSCSNSPTRSKSNLPGDHRPSRGGGGVEDVRLCWIPKATADRAPRHDECWPDAQGRGRSSRSRQFQVWRCFDSATDTNILRYNDWVFAWHDGSTLRMLHMMSPAASIRRHLIAGSRAGASAGEAADRGTDEGGPECRRQHRQHRHGG